MFGRNEKTECTTFRTAEAAGRGGESGAVSRLKTLDFHFFFLINFTHG